MPKIGTITKLFTKNGALIEMGAPVAHVPGSGQPPFNGVIGGIFYVSGDEYEPEHYDVVGVPQTIFKVLNALAAGTEPEAVYKSMMLEAQTIMAQTKAPPSGIRRVYQLTPDGPLLTHEASLSIQDIWEHFQDRLIDAMTAYDESEEDKIDAPAQPQAVNGHQPQAPAGS